MELKHPINVPVAERLYRLEEEYIYIWEKAGTGQEVTTKYRIVVPVGFLYDGASVPRIAWTISGITPDGLIRAAALIHDWIYRFDGRLPEGSYQYEDKDGKWLNLYAVWSRRAADRIFGRIMREAGVSKIKRRMAFIAVRMFGWLAW